MSDFSSNPENYIARMEAAEAEVERLNKLCEQAWKQMDDAFTQSLRDNMARVKLEAHINRLRSALEGLREVSHRLPGCPDPECIPCLENSRALDAAREALAATPEQSLARVRNEVLEEAMKSIDALFSKMLNMDACGAQLLAQVHTDCVKAVRALKVPHD